MNQSSKLFRVFILRHCRFSVRKLRHKPTNNDKSLSHSIQLNQSIDKRIENLRNEVDLGQGPVVENSSDILQESIIKAQTIETAKELISYNYRYLEARHVSQLFQSINNIIRFSNNESDIKYEFLASKEFELLANRTLRVARHLEASEALKTLIYVKNLGISPDTLLNQALLQMVRAWINEYSIGELYNLVNYLKNQKDVERKHSLTNALKFATSHALRHRINYKEIDLYNAKTLLKCLEMIAFFGSDVYGDIDSVTKCFAFINNQLNKLGPKEWLKLLSFIYQIEIFDEECSRIKRSLIDNCIENLISINRTLLAELPSHFFVNVLKKMGTNPIYYNKHLFDMIAEKSFDYQDRFGINNIYMILQKNYQHKYVNYKQLKLFAEMIDNEDPKLLESPVSLVKLFRFFTLPCDHTKIHRNFTLIAKKIAATKKFEEEISNYKMNCFHFLNDCMILNAKLNENLIVGWFEEFFSKAYDVCQANSQRLQFLETMATIYQGLFFNKVADLNSYNSDHIREKVQPFVEEYRNIIRNGKENMSPTRERLFQIVSQLVDPNPLARNYATESGIVLDLKFDYRNSNQIGFIFLTRKDYCRDPKILRGKTQFLINSIENLNIHLIPIDLEIFDRLSDSEKPIMIENELKFLLKKHNLN